MLYFVIKIMFVGVYKMECVLIFYEVMVLIVC